MQNNANNSPPEEGFAKKFWELWNSFAMGVIENLSEEDLIMLKERAAQREMERQKQSSDCHATQRRAG